MLSFVLFISCLFEELPPNNISSVLLTIITFGSICFGIISTKTEHNRNREWTKTEHRWNSLCSIRLCSVYISCSVNLCSIYVLSMFCLYSMFCFKIYVPSIFHVLFMFHLIYVLSVFCLHFIYILFCSIYAPSIFHLCSVLFHLCSFFLPAIFCLCSGCVPSTFHLWYVQFMSVLFRLYFISDFVSAQANKAKTGFSALRVYPQ